MPTIIKAAQWDFDPQKIDTGFQQNHGQPLSTEDILQSLDDIATRKEMEELNELIRQSPQFCRGTNDEER